MKKYFKLLIITLIGFLTFNSYVMAREVDIDELGKEIEKVNKNATFAYIVGNYAFTSSKSITLEDVMIASRSIELAGFNDEYDFDPNIKNDNVYKTMNIYQIRKSYGAWKSGSNLIGTKTLDQAINESDGKINIDYIDYKYVAKDTVISISDNVSQYNGKLQELNYKDNNFSFNSSEKTVSGIAKINKDATEVPEKTDYYFAYVLHVDGATKDTTVDVPDNVAKIIETDYDNGNYVILMSLKTTNDNYYKVTVDRDGAKTHYNANSYYLYFRGVKFQSYTKADFDLDSKNIDGYVVEKNENVDLNTDELTMKVSGQLYKQFNIQKFSNKNDAYYISLKTNKKLTNVTVTLNGNSDDVNINKGENETTIIFRITEDKMTTCQGKDTDECKFKIVIDEDGADKEEFLPSTYYLDFSGVTPKIVTKIDTMAVVAKNAEGELVQAYENNNQQLVGYLTKNNEITYSLTTAEEPTAIDGVVKISDNTGNKGTYNGSQFINKKLDIKYQITESDNKNFTITVDLDGNGTKYDATELTIDYTGLYAGENAQTEYATYLTKTKAALSVTVHNIIDDTVQEYEKGDANRRLITDYKNGIQSYTFNMYGNPYVDSKTYEQLDGQIRYQYNVKSLIRKVTFDNKAVATKEEWKFEFGGYSGIGVIELSLMDRFNEISEALNVEDLNYISETAKTLLKDSNVKYYNVTIDASDINNWVKKYYGYQLTGDSSKGSLILTIAIDNDGYIRYLTNLANSYSNKQGWEEKTLSQTINRKIEIVLDKIGTTRVPGLEAMDLSIEKVTDLENKWHEERGCKREANYYVCRSN